MIMTHNLHIPYIGVSRRDSYAAAVTAPWAGFDHSFMISHLAVLRDNRESCLLRFDSAVSSILSKSGENGKT
jgi:hypothetical protein